MIRIPHHSALALGMILLVGGAAGQATQPASKPAMTDADRAMLHRLETGGWQERKHVEQELSKWPPDREPDIRAMLASTTNPEAASRLKAVIQQMQEHRLSNISLITLHVKQGSAKSVYSELFRQAGAPLRTDPADLLDDPSLPKLTVDADDQPFWTVMQELSKASGIGMSLQADGAYQLRRGATIAPGPQVIDGPLLLVLSQASAGLPTPRAGKPAPLELQIYPEPKVRLFGMSPVLRFDHAADSNGNSLQVDPGKSLQMFPVIAQPTPWQIPLQRASKNPGDRLVSFCAALSVTAQVAPQHIEIDHLSQAAPRDIWLGQDVVRFEGCTKKKDGTYWVSFTVASPAVHLGVLTANMQVTDRDGNAFFPCGASSAAAPNAKATIVLQYASRPRAKGPPIGEPAKLAADVYCLSRTIQVNLDLKNINIPLPGGG